jgi:tetratricopeptide (TPR) repeat protein
MLVSTARRLVAATARRWRVDRLVRRARRLKTRKGANAAAVLLTQAVAAFPLEARLWNDLAAQNIDQGDFAAARANADRALQLQPDLPEAHCNMGLILAQLGDEAGALRLLERALQLDPSLEEAHVNRALLLSRMLCVEPALMAWAEVLRRNPRCVEAHAAKSALLMRLGRHAEAQTSLDAAGALGLDAAALKLNRALLEGDVGDPDRAVRALHALRGQADNADIEWGLALIHLARGDFASGWPLYEARLTKSFDSPRRAYGLPAWQGEPLQEGALLVMAEQGLGDEIMFASCYPDVIERAPRCVIECDPRLATLFERSFPGCRVKGVPRSNDQRWLQNHPELRCQIHAGSLPGLFRERESLFPRHAGYLRPDPRRVEYWRGRLAGLGKAMKVGIAWSGGLAHTRRTLRCVPLAELAALHGSQRVFISLQHDDDGSGLARLKELSGARVHAFPEALRDLDECAALLRALDVVVTACSSIAHFGGAVGTPTWVLTPRVAEWRYLRSGETLPWYPSVRLFRQGQDGNWSAVVTRVKEALAMAAARET